MSKIGADIGQMQALKQAFEKEAGDVERLMSSIGNQVDSTWWVGPASDKFRNEWTSVFKPNLTKLQAALREAATEVERRRSAIEQAGS